MCPDLVPIATRFCTGSYAKAVGWYGKPCLIVYKASHNATVYGNTYDIKTSLVHSCTKN